MSCTLKEWGLEGYHLWLIGTQSTEEETSQYESVDQSHLIQLQFVKSSLTVNPCMVCTGYQYVTIMISKVSVKIIISSSLNYYDFHAEKLH